MSALKLQRYIKTPTGEKTEMIVRSVNITAQQHEYLNENNFNLSMLTREYLDKVIAQHKKETEK